MCKKLIYFVSVVLLLGSVSNAEDIQWTDLGADHLWSTPENWDLGRVPTLADDVRIDVPAAAAPNGPVIQDGTDAKANGIFTEAPGEPSLTMTGGTLEVAEWIWYGDGADSFGIWDMSGGTVTVANEFELGWDGGAGTLTMTGGTINAGEAVIPTGSGAFGELFLNGGTYNVIKPGGLSVTENGLIDITEGTLVLEGDETAKVNDLIAAGLITAYGGDGQLELDFDGRNPGKTTLTATIEKTVLFAEDFEGLELGPNVDEALAGDAVWTDTPPEGWTVDESGIPGIGLDATDGVTEWAGWAFADKEWWIEAAEDQDRSTFELGIGTVAVADPDEWDDAERLPIPISAEPYDTWLTTPEINIASAEAGTLELKFDSSWRPEFDDNYHQTANITASFDGGDPVEVMLWESDEASANFHPYATNETVIVKLDNLEGAKKLVLTFGLFDAGNDWWWAIDNLEVRGVVPYMGPVDPGSSGLLAWWTCDEGAGTVVGDASGNGRDGTFVNGDPAWVEGIRGSAVELVGPTLIEVPPLDVELTEATMAGWIKPNGAQPDWSSIIMTRDPGLATGFNILGYQLAYHWNDDSGSWSHRGGDMIAEDGWTFAAVTIEPDKATFYVNGVPGSVNEISHGPCTWNSNIYLGGDGTDAWVARRMNGALDDVLIYDRALSEAEIRYLAGERATPVDPGTYGLVAYYALENNTDDSSGNGLHGTIVGEPTYVDGPAGYGTAMAFDGVDDYVDFGNDPLFDITEQVTLAVWVNANDMLNSEHNPWLGKGDHCYAIKHQSGNYLEFFIYDGGWNSTQFTDYDESMNGEWHHTAGTYDGSDLKFYLDGELSATLVHEGSIETREHPVTMGTNSEAGGRFYDGALDEGVIYNRALSEGEVRYLAGFRPMVDPGTDALIAYYPLDIDTLDASGNGNDGTVNGDPNFVDGVIGTAMEFDGDGDFLDCGNDPILALTDAVSISSWIKVAVQGADHKVGGNQDGATGGYKMSVYSDKIEFEIRTSGNSAVLNRSVAGGTVLEVDVWYHVNGVYSLADGYIRTYVDGELDRELETTEALGASPGPLMIGCEPFSSGQYNFNGVMDDIRVYNKALSEAEARYLANN